MPRKRTKSHTDQHFVPKSYLKAWLEDEIPPGSTKPAFVWAFNSDGTNPRRISPLKLFTAKNLYTLPSKDGGRDLRLEHALGEVEDRFASTRISKFNNRREPSHEEWLWIATFVATAYSRTKAMIGHHVEQMRQLYDMVDAMTEQVEADRVAGVKRDYPPSLADPKNTYTPQPGDFERMRAIAPETLLKTSVDVVSPVLSKMHKTILCTDDSIGFVTSDVPCTWCDPSAEADGSSGVRGVGILNRGIEVTIPLSPRQCLVYTHRPISNRLYIDCPESTVTALNVRHIAYSDETFISRSSELKSGWL